MLEFTYKRPTRKEHGHTAVIIDGQHVGYFMPNRSKHRIVGENYNFVRNNSSPKFPTRVYTSNRKKMIALLEACEKKIIGSPIDLKKKD